MKKFVTITFLSIILLSLNTSAQTSSLYQFYKLYQNEGMLGGGAGVTWIDGKPYYSVHLFPEFVFSNFGFGLDLNMEFSSDGKLRNENFNDFSDYLSIIRYVRYGYKGDPFYARLGALDYATLGHGTIMYMYNNSPSYDNRKTGLALDIDFTTFGIETVYGSFGEKGVMGLRGFTRPLQFTDARDIPILSNFEIGASIITDLNDNTGVVNGTYDSDTDDFEVTEDKGEVTVVGIDFGLPIIRMSKFNLELYADYNKILRFGSGFATGFIADFNGLGIVDLRTKFERRINGKQYLPSYFNSLYEIERFQLDKSTGEVDSKIQRLDEDLPSSNGWYGELTVSVLGTVNVLGSYQRLDKDPDSGILHLETNVLPEDFPYVLRGGYDKINIEDEGDIFTLDDRSYLFAEFGYKPVPYLIVSLMYNWTFTPVRDNDDNIIDYEPQKKIEPRISFLYPVTF